MAETKIEWTDYTFNPWRGCSKVNTGCKNCYADREAKRFPKNRGIFGTLEQGGTRVVASENMWRQPIKWNELADWVCPHGYPNKPTFVFCSSLADVFEDWQGPMLDHNGARIYVDTASNWQTWDEWDDDDSYHDSEWDQMQIDGCRWLAITDVRRRLFQIIDSTPFLTWQLLTKRPENIRSMWLAPRSEAIDCPGHPLLYRENLWLGTSVADQSTAAKAMPELARCRDLANKLFLSVEPLVGPVDLTKIWTESGSAKGGCPVLPLIDWVIVGGESGPKARPCNIKWIYDIIDQCRAAGVSVFVKQVGSNSYYCNNIHDSSVASPGAIVDCFGEGCEQLTITHRKGGDPEEWSDRLRVREFPVEVTA